MSLVVVVFPLIPVTCILVGILAIALESATYSLTKPATKQARMEPMSTAPYKALLINGMVKGTDGRMMHKSYGNYVEADEAIKKVGADALRQWAAAGRSTGYDIPFRWNEREYGKNSLTNLWQEHTSIAATTTTPPPS